MTKHTKIVTDFDETGTAIFIVECYEDHDSQESVIEQAFSYYNEAKQFAREYIYGRVEVQT